MKQTQFEAEHAPLWEEIGAILEGRKQNQEAFPSLYRRLCQCLALSGQRGYSPALTDYLQQMVAACHKRLYGSMVGRPQTLLRWLGHDFPRRVREEWRLLLLAALAFWGVSLATGLLVWYQPHWAYSFMSPEQLRSIRQMYQPSQIHIGRGGDAGDVMMFGFYIWNNVSICFRTFAGGIFGGVPSLISMAVNGINGGVVASWLSKEAATRGTFWPFVVTHSSFEITASICSR